MNWATVKPKLDFFEVSYVYEPMYPIKYIHQILQIPKSSKGVPVTNSLADQVKNDIQAIEDKDFEAAITKAAKNIQLEGDRNVFDTLHYTIPIRTEIEVLLADKPTQLELDWTMKEETGIGVVNPSVTSVLVDDYSASKNPTIDDCSSLKLSIGDNIMKIGQRWMFETEKFKYIIELLEIDVNGQANLHKCRVVQIIRAGQSLLSVGEVHTWKFSDLSTWTYLQGQDRPE